MTARRTAKKAAQGAEAMSDLDKMRTDAQLALQQQARPMIAVPAATLIALVDCAKAITDHNEACQAMCGIGDQEAVRCKYRPYFERTGRRCTTCPTYYMIEAPFLAKQEQKQ
jgi:hypothetical protein